jgi:hypothetical protein
VGAAGGQRLQANLETNQDSITKKGTIIYKVGASAIRDDGDKLNVSREATKEGLDKALRMAMERYGNHITVNGSQGFKDNIVRAAVAGKLPITFADGELERRRQILSAASRRPNVPRIGTAPPPEARNCLLTMADIPVLRLDGVGEAARPEDARNTTQPVQADNARRPPPPEPQKAAVKKSKGRSR